MIKSLGFILALGVFSSCRINETHIALVVKQRASPTGEVILFYHRDFYTGFCKSCCGCNSTDTRTCGSIVSMVSRLYGILLENNTYNYRRFGTAQSLFFRHDWRLCVSSHRDKFYALHVSFGWRPFVIDTLMRHFELSLPRAAREHQAGGSSRPAAHKPH